MKSLRLALFCVIPLSLLSVWAQMTLSPSTITPTITPTTTVYPIETVTYSATTDLNCNNANYKTLSLTGNVTFTTSNKAAGKWFTVIITADGSTRNFTFPAWVFVGSAAPTSIAANKTGALTVFFTSTTDASGVATYNVQP